jgi:lipopolysaccharide export system protein LptA
MPRLRDTLAAAALAVWVVDPAAAAGRNEPPSGGLFDLGTASNRKDPITVNADRLEYDYKNNIVVYRGDVQASQGQVKLRSDTLTVTFENVKDATAKDGAKDSAPPPKADPQVPDPGAKGTQRVHEVIAVGHVRIDQGARWATGGRAVFDQTQRTLVLTENPILHEGPNEVAGDRVVVFLDENRSVVEGGRKRVKAVLYPAKDGTLATAKDPAHPEPTAESPPHDTDQAHP